VGNVGIEEVVFNDLWVALVSPAHGLLGVAWPLPVARWNSNVGDRTGVLGFEHAMKPLAHFASFLHFDEALENLFLAFIADCKAEIQSAIEQS